MEIRWIQEQDKGEWLLMRRALWPKDDMSTLATEMEAILQSLEDQAVFVSLDGATYAGFIELSIHHQAPGCHSHRIGFIEGWYVRPRYRHHGVGRQLAEAGEAWALAKDCVEMASDTTPEYTDSPVVHRALGYEEVDVPLHYRKPLNRMDPTFFDDIPEHTSWIQVEPWPLGWSDDRKYRVLDQDHHAYLLRVSDASTRTNKQRLYERLQQVEDQGIQASRPIAFGQRDNGEVYLVLSWLKGQDAATALRHMTPTRQYETGLEAGRLMRQLHALEPQQSNGEWWTFYEAILKQDLLVSFIKQNIDLVRNRPLAFQHVDFHVGNMLINDNGIALIDFDRSSMADPYDEFKPFVWNVQISPWFESGMVNGYFNDDIPSDFFPILALYAAESLISHIPWAMKYGETELHVAHQVAKDVLTWYDDFKRVIPRWYHAKPPKNEEE
jgi:aminoglycoside phosphotransferase (APT) family kinase protein/GNAT superfamily N-acetyltransferase